MSKTARSFVLTSERGRKKMEEKSNIERLVKRYGDALVRFAYCRTGNSAEAEDIAEDAFVALFLKNKTFENEAQERAYLFKTVANKCCDYHRRKTRAWVPLSDLENVLSFDGEAQAQAQCDNQTLYCHMQTLPAQYRQTLYLHYFEGFSVTEIAVVLHKNKKSVYNLLSRAKTALSASLKKEDFS